MDTSFVNGVIAFVGIAGAMSVVALAFVLPRLLQLRRAPGASAPSSTAANQVVYRSALRELDREAAGGLVDEDAYRRGRLDLERRLLAETLPDERVPASSQRRHTSLAVALAIALPVCGFALYGLFGEPAALRIDAMGETDAAANVDIGARATRVELAAHVARHPSDARGWILLARVDLTADRFDDAAQEYAKAVAVSAKAARDPAIWCELADALAMAQGGTLAGLPSELIARALSIDASHPKALEMAGSAAIEAQDYVTAARYWRQLLAQLPAGSETHRDVTAALVRVEARASLAASGRSRSVATTRESN